MSPFTDTIFNITPILERISDFFDNPNQFNETILSSEPFFVFQLALFSFTVIFFIGIVFLAVKINDMSRKTRKETAIRRVRLQKTKSVRWEIVETHMRSENPSEWKLAIMEADSILEEMVKKFGHSGTLGEMLKQIEISDFTTLNEAWEAHKVRNYIAHQGSTYLLTRHQANRVIRLYEKVFKEFEYI
jgi:hypothetical protein